MSVYFAWNLTPVCSRASPVKSPHKGQWRGALIVSFICAWINSWVNNRGAGDLRRHRPHCDVIVMWWLISVTYICIARPKDFWTWMECNSNIRGYNRKFKTHKIYFLNEQTRLNCSCWRGKPQPVMTIFRFNDSRKKVFQTKVLWRKNFTGWN